MNTFCNYYKNIFKLFQEVHHRLDFSVNVYGAFQKNICLIKTLMPICGG
jgi:hypothetical protein